MAVDSGAARRLRIGLTSVAPHNHTGDHMAGKRGKDDKDEVPVTVRFPVDVHADAAELAKRDERSFNLYVVRAVRSQIERDKKAR